MEKDKSGCGRVSTDHLWREMQAETVMEQERGRHDRSHVEGTDAMVGCPEYLLSQLIPRVIFIEQRVKDP